MQKRHLLLAAVLLSTGLHISACKGKSDPQNSNSPHDKQETNTIPCTAFRKDAILEITSPQGASKATFDVEIAATEEASRQGLMYRESMDLKQGMLFDPQGLSRNPFWMKNTYIPLDIIFIDEDQKILNIAKNTKPYSEERIDPAGFYRYVLEINAGFSHKLQLSIGDMITWE